MILHMMCGIPGSGKSTLAGRLPGYNISTDRIRKFLWHDESVVVHDRLVFQLAEQIAGYLLKLGEDVVFDATNLTVAKRGRLTGLAHKYKARVVLHWINCPLKTAVQRNAGRERRVPVKIIKSLYNSFQMPTNREGISIIKEYNQNLKIKRLYVQGLVLKRQKPSVFTVEGKKYLLKK